MYLCSDDHEEICHEYRQCPLCATIAKHSDAIDELEETHADEISDLKSEIEELKSQLP